MHPKQFVFHGSVFRFSVGLARYSLSIIDPLHLLERLLRSLLKPFPTAPSRGSWPPPRGGAPHGARRPCPGAVGSDAAASADVGGYGTTAMHYIRRPPRRPYIYSDVQFDDLFGTTQVKDMPYFFCITQRLYMFKMVLHTKNTKIPYMTYLQEADRHSSCHTRVISCPCRHVPPANTAPPPSDLDCKPRRGESCHSPRRVEVMIGSTVHGNW